MKNQIKFISSNVAYIDPDDTILKVTCAVVACSLHFSQPAKNYNGVFTVKKTDSTANAVTIYPYTGETIDGAASVTLTAQNDYKTFAPVGGGWAVVDSYSSLTVTTTGTQTLTNKTLTTPVISSGTLTTPVISSGTLTTPVINGGVLTDAATTFTLGAHNYDTAAADWTLSAAELLKPVHKPTNASGAVNAIVATTIRPYLFINATGHALTVKTAEGTGIAIANGKAAMVMSDGTNVIRLTPDE